MTMLDEPAIYAALAEIFRDLFGRGDLVLTPQLTATDVPGWDSFRQIEIIMASEERFGIKFTTRELDNLDSLGRLVAVIAARA